MSTPKGNAILHPLGLELIRIASRVVTMPLSFERPELFGYEGRLPGEVVDEIITGRVFTCEILASPGATVAIAPYLGKVITIGIGQYELTGVFHLEVQDESRLILHGNVFGIKFPVRGTGENGRQPS